VPGSSGTPAPGTPSLERQPLFTLHTDEPDRFDRALASLEGGYDMASDTSYEPSPWVIDRFSWVGRACPTQLVGVRGGGR
jgi:hypothetical protein